MSLSARSSTRATVTATAAALLGLLAACGGSDDASNGAVMDGADGTSLPDAGRADTWNPLDVIPPADTRVADTATPPDAADVATPDASARSCDLPWGGTVPDGASVTAYPAASVACGGSCASEERFCDDGALSGSATAQSCFVVACEACPAPWGGSVAHGASVTAYAAATAGCGAACISEVRSCADGVLSGSYPAQACTAIPCAPCALPWGGSIAHGSSATAYAAATAACGASCQSEARTCADGVLSGSYPAQACTATPCAPCALPWGGSIAHGAFTTAYASSSAACGGSCTSEVRTCIDGALSGSYGAQVCSVTPCASCALPWGGILAHGASVTAYAAASPSCGGACSSETRTCQNGVLSGTYAAQACSVAPCASCTLPWGGVLADGASVTAYAAAAPPCGGSCSSETRACHNGTLSGTYTAQACSVASCSSCALPWGGSIAHGASVTAYAAAAPACGGSCTSQTRSCQNGTLSGSYSAQSCTVAPCAPEIIFSTSFGGSPATTFYANQTIYGRIRHLTATNTQSCAEPLGNPVPNCRNGLPWTTLPNADWSYDTATSEWRAIFPGNSYPPVQVEMFVRNTQTGQLTTAILTLLNPCYWTAIVPGPVAPPTASCTTANQGSTTFYNGYTWTCQCG